MDFVISSRASKAKKFQRCEVGKFQIRCLSISIYQPHSAAVPEVVGQLRRRPGLNRGRIFLLVRYCQPFHFYGLKTEYDRSSEDRKSAYNSIRRFLELLVAVGLSIRHVHQRSSLMEQYMYIARHCSLQWTWAGSPHSSIISFICLYNGVECLLFLGRGLILIIASGTQSRPHSNPVMDAPWRS